MIERVKTLQILTLLIDQHNNIPWTGGPNIVKERKEREKAGRNKTPTQSTTTISAASAQTFGTTENRVAKHKPDNDFDPQPHPSFRTVQREDEMPVRYAESRITFLESKLHFLQFLESRMPLLESKIQSLENRAKKAEACDKASAIRINKLEQQVAQLKGKFTGIKKALQSRSHAR